MKRTLKHMPGDTSQDETSGRVRARYHARCFTFMLMLLLSGCVVGPDFQPPERPAEQHYLPASERSEHTIRQTQAAIPSQWWQLYGNARLNQLITQALQHSPTLEAAAARLRSMQETLSADVGSVLYPSATASVAASRQKISGVGFGNSAFATTYSLYRASVDVSYVIHPFGRGQRYLEAQQAQVDYQALQWQAARLMLIGNIITAAITEASLRAQIAAQQQVIAAHQQSLKISEQRFALGAIAKNELLLQRTSLAQAKTTLPALRKSLSGVRHQLAVLSGTTPAQAQLPVFTLEQFHMPQHLPLTLPSTMARQRPDLRAAETLLHQASAMVGVATAALYPQFSISASLAGEGMRLVDILKGQPVWNLGANLLQPLYNAGELRARRRAAIADFEQARASYRQTLLQAFGEVADSLMALQQDHQQWQSEQQAVRLAAESHRLIAEQFSHGSSSQLELLTAQSQWQQAKLSEIRSRAQLLSDSAALMQALGGNST